MLMGLSACQARRSLMPAASYDSEETLVLGQVDSRPEELASLLPDIVEGFNKRMEHVMGHPPEPVPRKVIDRGGVGSVFRF